MSKITQSQIDETIKYSEMLIKANDQHYVLPEALVMARVIIAMAEQLAIVALLEVAN